jgi:hypothetical protein
MKIARKKTIKEWINLVGDEKEPKINYISNEKWDEVFDFFEERIRTRYINPIHVILNLKDNLGEGFAIVNLQCSLIETVECFINGLIFQYPNFIMPSGVILKKGSKGVFESFFKKREPFNTMDIDGSDFYKSVRCGLLHETQTKNGWKTLAQGCDKSIENKIIYRNDFQLDIEKVIENYKKAIVHGIELNQIPTYELRENFIYKFNNICKTSLSDGNI